MGFDGGENYLRYRQIEFLPEIAPALAQAKLVTVHSGGENGDAASATTDSIASVIRTVLAAQIVTRGGGLVDPVQQGTVKNDGERAEAPFSKGARS
jgi:flotillin